ncbi:MAG: periplasmic heavy metal sensor [Candidatus Poribacteria bacterium]
MKKTFGILLAVGLIAIVAAVVFAQGMMGKSTGNANSMMGSGMMGMSMMQQMMCKMSDNECMMKSDGTDPLALADKLGLSKEQQNKVNDILTPYKKDMIKKNADLEIMGINLSELIQQEKPNLDSIKNQIKEMSDLEADMKYSRVNFDINIRSILTEAQRNALKGIQKNKCAITMGQMKTGEVKTEVKATNPDNSNPGSEEHLEHHK